ncbi:MAG: hypothetical protein Q8Q32_01680 [bacterium]|nr:hypothetical protein [bacterium]
MKKSGSILIKNGSVIDGSGAREERLDVFIKGEQIADVGRFPLRNADLVIDGTGMVVTPGFIDLNTASDHYLSIFTDPFQKRFLTQGISTIVGGLRGSSLAPILYGDLDSLMKWTDVNQVNIDWASFDELLNLLDRRGVGVNFASFVGYSTLRRAISSHYHDDLSAKEIDAVVRLGSDALDDGALGISFGLLHRDSGSTSSRELEEIYKLCSQKGALVATQPRYDGEKIFDAVEELASFADEFEVKTIVNTLVAVKGHEGEYKRAIERIEKSRYLYFDAHNFDHQTLPIHLLLPPEFRFGGIDKMMEFVESEIGRDGILEALGRVNGDKLVIASAPNFDFLVGRSLKEFANNHGLSVAKGLLKLMEMTRLRAVLFVENLNSKEAFEALKSDKAFFASSNPSLLSAHNVIDHPGGSANVFLNYLKDSENLEKAVKKISFDSASFLGFGDRGLVRSGYVADLCLLSDRIPEYVLISGEIVLEEGSANNRLAGKILRRT